MDKYITPKVSIFIVIWAISLVGALVLRESIIFLAPTLTSIVFIVVDMIEAGLKNGEI